MNHLKLNHHFSSVFVLGINKFIMDLKTTYIFKLVSGESIQAIILNEDNGVWEIAFPMELTQTKDSIILSDWLISSKEHICIIHTNDIITFTEASTESNNVYNKQLVSNLDNLSTPSMLDYFQYGHGLN